MAVAAEEDDDFEISAEELASLRHVAVPTTRGWSTPTFACHRHVSSCVLSCCCPCVQFGFNQRMALGASCVKWALVWLALIVTLYLLVDQLIVSEGGGAIDEMIAQEVERHINVKVPRHHGKGHGASTHVHAPVVPASAHAPVTTAANPPVSRSTAFLCAMPFAMLLCGVLGAYRRGMMRTKFGIGGSAFGDFVCHACCHCCSLAKEAREIRHQAIEEVSQRHGTLMHTDMGH